MQIRQANLSDLPRLEHLRDERYTLIRQADPRVTIPALSLKQAMDDVNAIILVAVMDDQIVGYLLGWASVSPYGKLPTNDVMIEEIALDAHKYYGGLGRALVAAFLEQYRTENTVVAVLVPKYHAVEQAFWRSLNAQPTEIIRLEIPVTSLWMILQ